MNTRRHTALTKQKDANISQDSSIQSSAVNLTGCAFTQGNTVKGDH